MRRERLPFFAGFGIEHGLVGRYFDRLSDVAYLEPKIKRLALRDEDLDIGPNQFLESRLFGGNGPKPGCEAGEDVKAGLGGNGMEGRSGALGGGVYGGTRYGRAMRVRDSPLERPRLSLGERRCRNCRERDQPDKKHVTALTPLVTC